MYDLVTFIMTFISFLDFVAAKVRVFYKHFLGLINTLFSKIPYALSD